MVTFQICWLAKGPSLCYLSFAPFCSSQPIHTTDQFLNRHPMAKVHDHPLKPRKTPYALRLRGSVLSRVWLQILIMALFSTAITCISELTSLNLGIQSTMISTLGFVVGLSLSFRTSSAYANWKEGRQAWEKLFSVSRNLSRLIWIHANDNGSTEDLLRKKSAMSTVHGSQWVLELTK